MEKLIIVATIIIIANVGLCESTDSWQILNSTEIASDSILNSIGNNLAKTELGFNLLFTKLLGFLQVKREYETNATRYAVSAIYSSSITMNETFVYYEGLYNLSDFTFNITNVPYVIDDSTNFKAASNGTSLYIENYLKTSLSLSIAVINALYVSNDTENTIIYCQLTDLLFANMEIWLGYSYLTKSIQQLYAINLPVFSFSQLPLQITMNTNNIDPTLVSSNCEGIKSYLMCWIIYSCSADYFVTNGNCYTFIGSMNFNVEAMRKVSSFQIGNQLYQKKAIKTIKNETQKSFGLNQ